MNGIKTSTSILALLFLIGCSDSINKPVVTEILNNEFKVKLVRSANEDLSKAVILIVPGSGGGFIKDESLYGLAFEGHPLVSIAYFGEKQLPKQIEKIPLEYLDSIVKWGRKNFMNRKIVMIGISKGAEYSLLYESQYNCLDGLICYSPSSFVFPNHVKVKKGKIMQSSWTYKNEEVPFAELDQFSTPAGKVVYKDYIEPLFETELEKSKSLIKVENIKCPILLLSGEDDLVWPTTRMAKLMEKKILKDKPKSKFKHKSYPNCGHQFFWFNKERPTKITDSQSMRLTGIKKHRFLYGGTMEGTINAMVDSRLEVLKFLDEL